MTAVWKEIDEAQARQHPLYGIGGWLLVYMVSNVLGMLMTFGMAQTVAWSTGMSLSALLALDSPEVTALKFLLFASVCGPLVSMLAGFTKARNFRIIATSCIWGTNLVVVICMSKISADGMGGSILGSLVASGIWTAYLHQSRRVRVTFEHSVHDDDPLLAYQQKQEPSVAPQAQPATPATPLPVPAVAHAPSSVIQSHPSAQPQAVVPLPIAESPEPSEAAWAQALAEYNGPERRSGLYAKFFSQTRGDETAIKALYIGQRAGEIQAAVLPIKAETPENLTEPPILATHLEGSFIPDFLHREESIFEDLDQNKQSAPNSSSHKNKDDYKYVSFVALICVFVTILVMWIDAYKSNPNNKLVSVNVTDAITTGAIVKSSPIPSAEEAIEALYGRKPLNGVLRVDAKTSAKTWFSQTITHHGQEYFVQFIQEQELDEAGKTIDFRTAHATISAMTYIHENGEWRSISRQRNLMEIGAWGHAPDVSSAELINTSNGNLIMKIPSSELAQGIENTALNLLGFSGNDWLPLGYFDISGDNLAACNDDGTENHSDMNPCWKYSTRLVVDKVKNGEWPTLKLIATGTMPSEDFTSIVNAATRKFVFDGRIYKIVQRKKGSVAMTQ